MYIKNDTVAMQAYNGLMKIDGAFSKSLLKINANSATPRAQYAPGFYGMANDMAAIHQTYTTGIQNLQDAVGFMEVAQTTMLELNDNLLDLLNLTQRASTGLLTSDQRMDLQEELSNTIVAMSDLIDNARYNEVSIFSTQGAYKALSIQYGEASGMMMSLTAFSMELSNLGVSVAMTISETSLALSALSTINSGIDHMNRMLTRMGAQINSVQSQIDLLTEQATQQKAMETRINGLDYAKEMANFTSLQVALQASNAMMAQSNSRSQMILQYFGG